MEWQTCTRPGCRACHPQLETQGQDYPQPTRPLEKSPTPEQEAPEQDEPFLQRSLGWWLKQKMQTAREALGGAAPTPSPKTEKENLLLPKQDTSTPELYTYPEAPKSPRRPASASSSTTTTSSKPVPSPRRPSPWVLVRRAEDLGPPAPPRFHASREEAMRAAVLAAVTGCGHARLQRAPHLVAAGVARAVGRAVSTTGSYGVFVAVVAALETMPLIDAGDRAAGVCFEVTKTRLDDALFAAMDAGLAAEAELAGAGAGDETPGLGSSGWGSWPGSESSWPGRSSRDEDVTPHDKVRALQALLTHL